jgi:hypothetical protein
MQRRDVLIRKTTPIGAVHLSVAGRREQKGGKVERADWANWAERRDWAERRREKRERDGPGWKEGMGERERWRWAGLYSFYYYYYLFFYIKGCYSHTLKGLEC